jgi:putative NIF3 family GTP cyclohydrolase 1 type 2
VVQEAINTPTSAIVSYHPPIFKPLSSLTLSNSIQKSLLLCASHGISVFSPHTSLDSVKGGINDWLADIVADFQTGTFDKHYVGEEKEAGLGGAGRLVRLYEPLPMSDLVSRIKHHLKLDTGKRKALLLKSRLALDSCPQFKWRTRLQ